MRKLKSKHLYGYLFLKTLWLDVLSGKVTSTELKFTSQALRELQGIFFFFQNEKLIRYVLIYIHIYIDRFKLKSKHFCCTSVRLEICRNVKKKKSATLIG